MYHIQLRQSGVLTYYVADNGSYNWVGMMKIRRGKDVEFMAKYHLYRHGRCPETMLYCIKTYVLSSIILWLTNTENVLLYICTRETCCCSRRTIIVFSLASIQRTTIVVFNQSLHCNYRKIIMYLVLNNSKSRYIPN